MSDSSNELQRLTEKRDELLLQEEIAYRETVLRHHEQATSMIPANGPTSLLEAWGDLINTQDTYRNDPDFQPRGQRISRADDRRDGDNAPHFRDEQTLAQIRGMGEWIAQADSTAMGALETLTSYVIHTGFTWTVTPSNPNNKRAMQLADSVQAVLDEFLMRERWTGSLDRELFKRKRRAGERFVRIRKAGDGRSYTEIYEPGWITQPQNPREIEQHYGLPVGLNWKYGIATLATRPDIAVGYWSFRYGDTALGEFIPADEMSHAKCNTDRNVKRGMSDYYVSSEWLQDSAKLLRNAMQGGTIQASIALLRTWKDGTSRAKIASTVDGSVEFQSKLPSLGDSGGSRSIPTEHWFPGKIVDHKGGDLKPGPMGSSNAPTFINLVQAGLRKAANSHSMPEFMFTGDASNANYSSTLVSESPFVKHCESLQTEEDTDSAEILWRVVKNAVDTGLIEGASIEELQVLLDITAEHPDVATRDKDKEHRIRSDEHKAGVLSRQTWAEEAGRDWAQEQQRIAQEPPVDAQPMFGALPTPPSAERSASIGAALESLERFNDVEEAHAILEALSTQPAGGPVGPFLRELQEHKPGTHNQKDHGRQGAAGGSEGSLTAALSGFREDSKAVAKVDPDELKFTESGQQRDRLKQVRELWPDTSEMPPVVAIAKYDSADIIDGHHRATVARERGDKLPVVFVGEKEYEAMNDAGFDAIEISYAVLDRAGQYEASSALDAQFRGSDVAGRGDQAAAHLTESVCGLGKTSRGQFEQAAKYLEALT